MSTRSVLLASLAVALAGGAAHAVPHTVSFTARITDTAGVPVEGQIDLKVQVFDDAQAGTMIWEEIQAGVPAEKGLVYASLGGVDTQGNGLDDAVFDGRPMFLQLIVDGDPLSPRIPLASVPYALRSGALDGFDPSSVQPKVTGTCGGGTFITAVNPDGSVVCGTDQVGTGDITGVSGTGGITGGGTSGAVSLTIDQAVIQARISGTCTSGFMTGVNQNGTVACGAEAGTGDITGVSGTGGITGGGTSGAVSLTIDQTVIQARITGACASGFMTGVNQNGTVACGAEAGTGDITAVTGSGGLSAGGTSGAIALSILDGGVTSAKLATGSVIAGKIAADAVGAAEITDGTVGTAEIADGTVATADLATGAVTTTQILDGTIAAADLASNSVTTAKINANAVTTAKIANDAVTMAKTSAPIGQIAITGIAGGTMYQTGSFTADAAGSCYVTSWAVSTSNATIGVEPALLAIVANTQTYYNQPSGSYYGSGGPNFGYQAQGTAVFNVVSGEQYRFGCHVEGSGNVDCRVTWICN